MVVRFPLTHLSKKSNFFSRNCCFLRVKVISPKSNELRVSWLLSTFLQFLPSCLRTIVFGHCYLALLSFLVNSSNTCPIHLFCPFYDGKHHLQRATDSVEHLTLVHWCPTISILNHICAYNISSRLLAINCPFLLFALKRACHSVFPCSPATHTVFLFRISYRLSSNLPVVHDPICISCPLYFLKLFLAIATLNSFCSNLHQSQFILPYFSKPITFLLFQTYNETILLTATQNISDYSLLIAYIETPNKIKYYHRTRIPLKLYLTSI